jgi:hypothetical protein
MTRLWSRCAMAAFAVTSCGTALGQLSTIDLYDRCVSDSAAFARDEKLNEVVAEYLAGIQREMDSSLEISRVAGMAGLEERSRQARLRADQNRRELQQACAHTSQSVKEAGQHPGAGRNEPVQGAQPGERQRQAVVELELNRRVLGATFLMNEPGFSQWLDGKQGRLPRRDLWEQALLAGNMEQAALMLREYERALKSR